MCDRKISGIGGKSGRNECAQVEMESLRKHVVDAGVATTGEPDKAFGKDCAPESTVDEYAGLHKLDRRAPAVPRNHRHLPAGHPGVVLREPARCGAIRISKGDRFRVFT